MTTTPGSLPIASTRQTLRDMAALLRVRPVRTLATIAILGAGVAASITAPWLVGAMIDDIQQGGGDFWALSWILVAALFGGAVVTWAGRVLLAGIVQRAVRDLREAAFSTALAQSSQRLEAAGTGDLVARLSGDIRAVSAVVSTALPAFLTALMTTVLSMAGIGLIDYRLAAAALIPAPIQYLALRRFLRRSGPVYRNHRAAQATRGQRLIETVRGSDTVRALGTERIHLDSLADASHTVIGHELHATHLRNTFYGRLNLAELIGITAVLIAGFLLVQSDAVTLGAATAAALYFLGLFDPIGTLLGTVDDLQDAGASLARLFGLTGMPSVEDPGTPLLPAAGRIELTNVTHRYRRGAPDLDNVTVTIEPGEHIVVVGASGAGKSTLAKVAAGLLRPDTGKVLVDGRPLDAWHPRDLRGNISMISQEPHVFAGTIRDDLHLFGPGSTDERLLSVVGDLGDRWLLALPDGLDTVVGAGGHALTPAQSQHLALARLALTAAPVVILDEATAEAGSEEGESLDRAVQRIIRGRTSIIIAHRLSAALHADRVIVMDDGRIVQDGTHTALLHADGPYARLWRAHQETAS